MLITAIGGGENTAKYVDGCVVVIVVLSKRLLTDPYALYEIWKALRQGIPLITVVLSGEGYDFQDAAEAVADFPAWFERKRPIDAALTAIIAIPWSPTQGRNHTDGVLNGICDRLPKRLSRQSSRLQLGKSTDRLTRSQSAPRFSRFPSSSNKSLRA